MRDTARIWGTEPIVNLKSIVFLVGVGFCFHYVFGFEAHRRPGVCLTLELRIMTLLLANNVVLLASWGSDLQHVV